MPYATIDSPNQHFDTTTYTANGGSQTITNSGSMQPDFFWGKVRSTTSNNILINSIVGVSKYLYSNSDATEVTDANYLTSFNSNGFSVGSNNYSNGTTMVAWQWKGGGTGVSNTAGTISSTVSANTTSGFSIVSYTGTGANATVGHGLGVAPSMIITKSRNDTSDWYVYHASLGNTKNIFLSSSAAASTSSAWWNNTSPTSTVFSVGNQTGNNGSGVTIIAYCFAEVKGFSKAFSYTGNGSTDGTFIYTGFKPAMVILKRTDSAGFNWVIHDNKRDTDNPDSAYLHPNTTGSESTDRDIDLLSNGFKMRNSNTTWNASGGTYIGFAVAESPFVSSKGVPVCAR